MVNVPKSLVVNKAVTADAARPSTVTRLGGVPLDAAPYVASSGSREPVVWFNARRRGMHHLDLLFEIANYSVIQQLVSGVTGDQGMVVATANGDQEWSFPYNIFNFLFGIISSLSVRVFFFSDLTDARAQAMF